MRQKRGMQRRAFLKTTVVAVGGTTVLGCGDSGGGEVQDPFDGLEVKENTNLYPQSVASGDPKPDSVILWTRVAPEDGAKRVSVRLQVALDPDFVDLVDVGEPTIEALAAHDHCVRVRLEGLAAGMDYYYRFGVVEGMTVSVSRTGRTRTAVSEDADAQVRFAVTSCQDYVGRYYHVYEHMAEQDLDFVVHLGDYIYETLGDPTFQSASAPSFDDEDGAIALGEGEDRFFAARSLDNYRQLYKLVRSDAQLQKVHERSAMIAVWDDHEFTDDAHGQTSTYFDGREDERDPTRRANADQAWFEYMPVDYAEPDFEYDRDAAEFPSDITIYRDFHFGKHLHLVMTDLRRYRSDHLVPEDAFPGAVAVTQKELKALGELPDWAEAYVDFDDPAYEEQATFLNAHAEALGFVEGDFAGLVGVDFANAQITAASADDKPAEIDGSDAPLGMTWSRCFKTERFSSVGSRYVVRRLPYLALSQARWNADDGESEQAMGKKQERWFIDTLTESDSTWKVWGNEYTLMTRTVDLSEVAEAAVIELKDELSLSVEDWDGMPSRRAHLLKAVGSVDNLVAVTGDIHSFFAGVARPAGSTDDGIIEFVAGMVSSSSYGELITAVAKSISPLAVGLANNIEDLLLAGNPHLAYLAVDRAGYGLCELNADELSMTYYSIEASQVTESKLAKPVEEAFESVRFAVTAGDKRLKRPKGDSLEVWDDQAGEWM